MPKFCPSCGKPLQFENTEICPNCGVRLKSLNTPKKQDSKRSIIFLFAAGIGILFLFFIIVAVIAAFVFGMAGTSTSPVQTPEQITYQTIVTPTIVTKQTIINSKGDTGWVKYTSYEDHFSIYRPSDWTITPIDSTTVWGPNSKFMDKAVYVYSPNLKGFIMIYGMDFSGSIYSVYNDPGKTTISDQFYDAFVQGIKQGETDQIKVTSLVKDSNQYQINGNPARRVSVYSQSGGEPLSGDFYLIAHGNSYYVIGYFAMTGSLQSDSSTATNIMRTFSTT
jgi:hypothetical protein